MKVFVIGAGAAGMIAAIAAASRGAKVTLLECMDKPGRKLLGTGNGRCNLSTLDPLYKDRYLSSDPDALRLLTEEIFAQMSSERTLKFFAGLGLYTRAREEYVYPASSQAAGVVNALVREIDRLQCRIRLSTAVRSLSYEPLSHTWKIAADNWEYTADRVIVTCGTPAGPTGRIHEVQTLFSSLPGDKEAFLPSLCALKISDPYLTEAAGARSFANVLLTITGAPGTSCRNASSPTQEFRESGELQWRKDALSGIVIFQLSRYASRALAAKQKVSLLVDLVPGYSDDELLSGWERYCRHVLSRGQSVPGPEELLDGLLPDRVVSYLIKRIQKTDLSRFTQKNLTQQLQGLCRLVKNLPFEITDTDPFSQAQVCAGGVALSAVNPRTLEAVSMPGLYLAGEVLDIEGPCGGYNLQWAWSSGYVAGVHAGSD